MKERIISGFLRIKNKNGSIMIVVLTMMSFIIALSAGLLLAVNSERNMLAEQTRHKQLYQMTVSANEFVFDYLEVYFSSIAKGTAFNAPTAPELVKKLPSLNVDDKITFNEVFLSNGMAELPNASQAAYRYITEITMKEKDTVSESRTTIYYFDVSTTGFYKTPEGDWSADSMEVVQRMSVKEYIPPTADSPEDTKKYFNMAVGTVGLEERNLDRDTNKLSSFIMDYSAYFGNQKVLWQTSGSVEKEIATFGAFENQGVAIGGSSEVIINTRTNYKYDRDGVNMSPNGGLLRIGEYFLMYGPLAGNASNPTYVYLLGQAYPGSNNNKTLLKQATDVYSACVYDNTIIFANGDIVLEKSTFGGTFFINGNLRINGNTNEHKGTYYVTGDLSLHDGYHDPYRFSSATFYVGGTASGDGFTKKEEWADPSVLETIKAKVKTANGNAYDWTSPASRTKFPWGTYEAWPVKRSGCNPATFPLSEFETVEECFNNLNYKTVALSYDENGEPISVDGNYVLKSRPLDSTGAVKTLTSGLGQSYEIETKVISNPNYIATFEYKFKDSTLPSSVDAESRLSPKAYPIWFPTDKLYERGGGENIEAAEKSDPNHPNNNEIDIGENSTSDLIIGDSGFIKTMVHSNAAGRKIIIDTTAGRDPDNPTTHKDIHIRLCGNANSKKDFKWFNGYQANLNILVRGAGSVIFYLDTDVAYNVKDNQNIFIGHEAWYEEFKSGMNIDTIKNYIHPEKACGLADCLYCQGQSTGESPGAYLIRQDNTPYGGLIDKYCNNNDADGGQNLFLHNNVFIVNSSEYGGVSSNTTGKELNYFNLSRYFCYIYTNFSNMNVYMGNSHGQNFLVGAAIGGKYTSGTGISMIIRHLMPAFYYTGLENESTNPLDYNRNSNRYVYKRNVMSTYLNEEGDDDDGGGGGGVPAEPVLTFSSIGFR